MKKFSRILSILMAVCLMATLAVPTFAAEIADATIDMDRLANLTIYKYDYTNASKDGIWNRESYVSTGQYDANINNILGTDSESVLGNGEKANGYAIKGVEYTYLKVADFYQYSEFENDGGTSAHVELMYQFDKDLAADLLKAIGLEDGKGSYANANALDGSSWYYQSGVLNKALAAALNANATTVKNALEAYVKAQGGTAMPLTDQNGRSIATNLPVGLYLLVETKVPEAVTSTTNPFFVSLPMTNVNGGGNDVNGNTTHITNGGSSWLYDVSVYPKNETGLVTLEKTVREAKKDSAAHGGSTTDITDGYGHYATASTGDTVEYQIISTLPTITSTATNIAEYTFRDVLARGLSYDSKTPVQIEWYTDTACTDLVTIWQATDNRFEAATTENSDGSHTMTISMTEAGLAEINAANTDSLYAGYSNYTMRVTYAAILNSDESMVYGDAANCSEVVLTWRRSSNAYFDTLIDDTHIYSYGIDLTKEFEDGKTEQSLFDRVLFKVRNESDGYYVIAELNEAEGIWYVTGHTDQESAATAMNPVEWNGQAGQLVIKGLEDDEYILTEIQTANGYILLKDNISVKISVADDAGRPCGVYAGDALGVVQNDPRFSSDGGLDLSLANIAQLLKAHNYLTASAAVDGNPVTMLADEMDTGSTNALATLKVVNGKGQDLPPTGDPSMMMLTTCGTLLIVSPLCLCVLILTKKEHQGTGT